MFWTSTKVPILHSCTLRKTPRSRGTASSLRLDDNWKIESLKAAPRELMRGLIPVDLTDVRHSLLRPLGLKYTKFMRQGLARSAGGLVFTKRKYQSLRSFRVCHSTLIPFSLPPESVILQASLEKHKFDIIWRPADSQAMRHTTTVRIA